MGASPQGLAAVRADVDRYYTDRLGRFGATPMGVGWTCVPTQELRFVQLAKLFDFAAGFSVNDVGCGYGALLAYLRRRHKKASIDYLGLDLSQAMVDEARRKWNAVSGVQFALPGASYRRADYCVASGVFNIKLGHGRAAWEALVAETLEQMYDRCARGVAVNFLAQDDTLDDLPEHYRCAPALWEAHARQLGATVELLEGYGLPEFTLLLRRQ
jgi:SAM-dependent methyltransferase